MSLVNCKTCGKKVSRNATSCPHCGEPEFISPCAQKTLTPRDASSYDDDRKTAPAKKEELKGWQIAVVLIIGLVAVIAYAFNSYSSGRRGPSESSARSAYKNPSASDLNFYARSAAEKIVKGKLKAPATASFSNMKVIAKSYDQFLVQTTVDAQNSFGATIRSTYLVVLRIDPTDASKYFHNPQYAVQEVSQPPTPEEIQAMKLLNGWK